MLKRNFSLGSLTLPFNIIHAPLAGCSDLPFRRMVRRHFPGLIYAEMVKMDALVRNDRHTFRLLDYETEMHPIGAQLCGSKPQFAGKCAKLIEELGFDVLDLNCGCPVDKVTKDGSGSALLKTPELIGEILTNMIRAVKIPVTIKIRAGWDESEINALEIMKVAERAGAKAICVHGRTRAQGYRGGANWDWIRACKEEAKSISVIANGDIFDPESAMRCFSHTGCDAILLARGAMGHPWLAEEIVKHFEARPPVGRTSEELREVLLQHFADIQDYQIERRAVTDMRRVGCWYLKRWRGAKELKEGLVRARSIEEITHLLHSFHWQKLIYEAGADAVMV